MNDGQDIQVEVAIKTLIFTDGTRVVGFEVIPRSPVSAYDLLCGLYWNQTFRAGFARAVADCEWWNKYEEFLFEG